MAFKSVPYESLSFNPFTKIGKEWALLTAGTENSFNTMTVSWGGLGYIWNKPVATVYVRPQRYTKEFVDREEYFTLSFFGPEHKKDLALCGAKSGRETDKIAQCGFTVACGEGGAPYFEQAELVLVCRKQMVMPMDPAAMPDEVKEKHYTGDYHDMYWGEIVEALVKE